MRRSLRHLLSQFRNVGTRRDGGYAKHSVSTSMRERGTRTPATATTAECNSYQARGLVLEDDNGRTWFLPASSSTALGSSIYGTVIHGENGAPQEFVVYGDLTAWERANREALR